MDATGIEGVNAEVGRLSERIWPQARRAREAALRSRPSTERNEASGQRRRSNRALFYDGRYSGPGLHEGHQVGAQGAGGKPERGGSGGGRVEVDGLRARRDHDSQAPRRIPAIDLEPPGLEDLLQEAFFQVPEAQGKPGVFAEVEPFRQYLDR